MRFEPKKPRKLIRVGSGYQKSFGQLEAKKKSLLHLDVNILKNITEIGLTRNLEDGNDDWNRDHRNQQ